MHVLITVMVQVSISLGYTKNTEEIANVIKSSGRHKTSTCNF